MLLKRIFSIIFMLIFGYLIGWLFMQAMKPEVLPVGSSLPELEYHDSRGTKTLKHFRDLNTIIVLFNSKCEHCRYQLKQFNENIARFVDAKLFFLTKEQHFFTKKYLVSDRKHLNLQKKHQLQIFGIA